MVNSVPETARICYDEKREAPYFCDHPKTMSCKAQGFAEFYFMLMAKLSDRSNRGILYRMPRKEGTNLAEIEFSSLSIIFEQHNSDL